MAILEDEMEVQHVVLIPFGLTTWRFRRQQESHCKAARPICGVRATPAHFRMC